VKAGSRQIVLRILFAVVILLPVSGLFAQAWQSTAEKLSFGERERQGIEYLSALDRLTVALTQAQSVAVNATPVDATALTQALDAVASTDARLGEGLRVKDRWADLRAKIVALSGQSLDPETAYARYGDLTDLLLALYSKVRENSNLIRDPDADSYYLQDAVAEELPQAIVAAGRYADLAVVAARRPAAEQAGTIADLVGAHGDVRSPTDDVADDVSAAMAMAQDRNLSNTVLAKYDQARASLDALSDLDAVLDGKFGADDVAALAKAKTTAIGAAADLAATMVSELDELIDVRLQGLRFQRGLSIAGMTLAVLIALVPLSVSAIETNRSGRRDQPAGRHDRTDNGDAAQVVAWSTVDRGELAGRRTRERSGAPR
jgi:hypothetical protein